MKLALDTTLLGQLCHPRRHHDVKLWYRGILGVRQHEVFLPEVVDYELRRELLRLGSTASLRALDAMPETEVVYLPISTPVMRDAAVLWASLASRGLPIGDDMSLGADVILAAQARAVGATVVTDNVRHLARMVPALRWQDV